MLSSENEKFVAYWSANREREKTSIKPLLMGLSGGFTIGIGVLAVLETGWYTRANMVANSRLSGFVFLIAILILSVFMAFIYRKFRWEMQEQRYLELMANKKRAENEVEKQP